jgi:site-specific DNA-cytosine methylase
MAHNFTATPDVTSEKLLSLIPEIVKAINPKCVTIEQVKPLAKTIHLHEKVVGDLTALGYHVQERMVNMALYGATVARMCSFIHDTIDIIF